MKKLKRLAIFVVVVLVAAVIGAFAMFQATFAGIARLPDGELKAPLSALVVRDGIVAAFIVPVGNGHAIAIDCGEDKEGKKVKAALTQASLTLDAILVTHGHPDHVGGCRALGAPIVALPAEAPGLLGEDRGFYRGPIQRVSPAHHLGLTIQQPASDGGTLTFGDKTVRVFAVPGHTAGSAAYLVDGVLYLGDAAAAGEDGGVVGPLRVFSDDVAMGKASLTALAARLSPGDVKVFAFSHSDTMPADLQKLGAPQ